MSTCPQCQQANAPGVKFCGECGTRLPILCPSCGEPNEATRKFCGECGAKLAAQATPAAAAAPVATASSVAPPGPATAKPAAPVSAFSEASPAAYTPRHLADKILTSKDAVEGERKIVTVLFSDVSGFTAMSERLDPEDVHAIMDRAFEVILNAVHLYEGTVNQFLGDGVMALFGAPIAHEDHGDRAMRAGLAIQDGLKPLAEEIRRRHGIEFRMRMGLNTGSVVVGAIGRDLRMDYTAVGDTTNLAARLLSVAKPGQIVVSGRTRLLGSRHFEFDDLGEFELKGKREPVRAYALRGEIQGRTRLEVSKERELTPLVGRDRELKALRDAFIRADAGQGAALLLTGEPGSGKSRLLYEFLSGLDRDGVLELSVTCASYGRQIAFRPVLELLRGYLGLAEAASPAEVRTALRQRLGELDLEDDERAVLLAHFIGVSAPAEFINRLSGVELRERTFTALRSVFLAASRVTPLVLLIENVHWLDTSSAEFIADLSRHLPDHSILLLLSTRPGPLPWTELPGLETITVAKLDAAEIDRMTRALLGTTGVSRELLALLEDKGEGNPLYVEELLHQLQETGGIVVSDGIARLQSADVKVPTSIHDIIAARVDRLVEPQKLTLQGASVVGRRFGTTLLGRVVLDREAVGRHLTALHGLDFVFPAAHDPELMYSFKHALTQDVIYGGLLDRRRRRYHAAAGRGLEEIYAGRLDEVVELLAHHFAASGDDEKAVDYALMAAEKAQRRWGNAEALEHFANAVKRLDTMPDTPANRARRIDAVVKQAEIKFALGRHADHIQALEGIRELVEADADPPRRAAWYYWTGFLHSLTGARPEIPIAYCREASSIAEAAGLEEIRATAECCLCHVYAYAGRLHDALEAGERALPVFEARNNVWWMCRTLWGVSLTAIPLGDWAKSLEACRRALELGEAVNDRRLKIVGLWRLGWTHIQRGDPETGIQSCDAALALAPSPFDAVMANAVHGYGLVKMGQTAVGIEKLVAAVEWLEKAKLTFTRTWYALWLADAYVRTGDAQRARTLAAQVLERSREAGYRYFEGMAERLIAASLIDTDPATAARHVDIGRQILEEVDSRPEVAKALVTEAELWRRVGDMPKARARLERALAIFESLDTLDEPARVRALLTALD